MRMKKDNLKYVRGSVQQDQVADIYYYTDVDSWSAQDFISEFDWLTQMGVSKINIHINSCGGSVVDGMGVFSRILDCKIPTACINDGLAASMGSIIWAAGDELYMKDYALLMIHNPFMNCDSDDAAKNQITDAFKKQIKNIYKSRFGFDDETINNIMDGKDGEDGTFFTAKEAIAQGFLDKDHVIVTPSAQKAKVEAAIKAGFNIKNLQNIMNQIAPMPVYALVGEQNHNKKQQLKQNQMNENEITVFAALLGLSGKNATVEGVSAQINDIKAKADQYQAVKLAHDKLIKERDTLKTELEGSKASVKNLTESLEKTKAALNTYKEAEAKAKEQRINTLVEQAINSCKINKADKETWMNLAKNDFDLAKKTLDSIPGRKELSKEIAFDADNEKEAQDKLKSEEKKMEEVVDTIVGDQFTFKHFDE